MNKSRLLSSLPFCSVHKHKLRHHGLITVGDLAHCSADHLEARIDVSIAEAEEILRVANEYLKKDELNMSVPVSLNGRGRTALDLLKKEDKAKRIITFSRNIDEMLEGGVKVGATMEICGSPGIGKTQLCMQLAVDATIPACFGGAGGEAVYIDTEGSFISERVAQIASSTVTHIRNLAAVSTDNATKRISSSYTLDHILSRIHYYRCHTHSQLIALTNILDTFLSEHPLVVIVIIDSIASPFRHGFKDLSLRTRLLSGLSQTLIKLAIEFELAVVLTNQMTTRSSEGNKKCLVPALGESWGHACTIRLMLYRDDEGDRQAFLFKSPSCKEHTVPFQVTSDGIRDATPTVSRNPCEPDSNFPVILTQTVQKNTRELNYESEDELDQLFEDASVCLDDFGGEIPASCPLKKRKRLDEALTKPDV